MTFPLFTEWYLWLFVILAPVAGLVLIRAFRVVRWAYALTREIRNLKQRAETASEEEAAAIAVVVAQCEAILKSPSPDLPTPESLQGYLMDVAGAFYPDAKRPELRVSIGHLIRTLNRSLDRFEKILQRPDLKHLKRVRIATVKTNTRRIKSIAAFPPVRWYYRYRQWVSGVNTLRLLLIPDPISWMIYLSGNLSIMVLGKCLMADLHLFVGRTALELYGKGTLDDEQDEDQESADGMEEVLEELGNLDDSPPGSLDPALEPLRKRITGMSAFLHTTPSLKTFWETVAESAEIIAQTHYPESEKPLDETRIGPILERTRHLLADIGKGEEIPVAGRLYRIRLETLESARRFADETIPKSVKEALTQGKKAYGWLKWPLVAYHLTARGGLIKVAAGIGWRTAGKGITLYLYGRLYDRAMEEVSSVCKRSNEM